MEELEQQEQLGELGEAEEAEDPAGLRLRVLVMLMALARLGTQEKSRAPEKMATESSPAHMLASSLMKTAESE